MRDLGTVALHIAEMMARADIAESPAIEIKFDNNHDKYRFQMQVKRDIDVGQYLDNAVLLGDFDRLTMHGIRITMTTK